MLLKASTKRRKARDRKAFNSLNDATFGSRRRSYPEKLFPITKFGLIASKTSSHKMRIYLLDRNAVSVVKDSVAGNRVPINRLAKLRSIDIRGNFVSPMLSIIEGQSSIKETREQLRATLKKESIALSAFFKNARTDSEYLIENEDHFSEAFSGEVEKKFNDYLDLVKLSHQFLAEPKSNKQLIRDEFLRFAHKRGISPGHPAIICCLATLYGNKDARKVLKPKLNGTDDEINRRSYNAASDLLVLSRMQNIHAIQSPRDRKNTKIKLLTFDDGLNGFLRAISVVGSNLKDSETTSSEVIYERSLFSGLSQDEYVSLLQEIKKSHE